MTQVRSTPPVSYVVGFLFRNNATEVALILKRRPERVRGMLNGIGGKIEPGEVPLAAMIREFREEAGAEVATWRAFATIESLAMNYGRIHCFTSDLQPVDPLRSMTDEEIIWKRVDQLHTANVHPQLSWLIPMALDSSVINSQITATA